MLKEIKTCRRFSVNRWHPYGYEVKFTTIVKDKKGRKKRITLRVIGTNKNSSIFNALRGIELYKKIGIN